MEEILNTFNQGWIGSLIGIIGIVVGIIVAVYFYRQSRIGPRLVYQIKALKIIGRDERAIPGDVKIFFGDAPVERLVKNLIIIWNSGYATFDGNNIINENPLRAEFGNDVRVMRVTPIKTTKPDNKSSAFINQTKQNEVIFSFNFLDPNEGAVFEIYHTGEELVPQIKGTIKGQPGGILNWGIIRTAQKTKPVKKIQNPILALITGIGALITIFVIVIVFLAFLYVTGMMIITGFSKGDWGAAIFLAIPATLIYFIYDTYWIERRKFPKSLMVDELNY